MFTTWDLLEFIKSSNQKAFNIEESNTKIIADLEYTLKGKDYEVNGKRRF